MWIFSSYLSSIIASRLGEYVQHKIGCPSASNTTILPPIVLDTDQLNCSAICTSSIQTSLSANFAFLSA